MIDPKSLCVVGFAIGTTLGMLLLSLKLVQRLSLSEIPSRTISTETTTRAR